MSTAIWALASMALLLAVISGFLARKRAYVTVEK